MNKLFLLLFVCLTFTQLSAQEPSPSLPEDTGKYVQIFYAVEESPEFPDGLEALDFYVDQHLEYPPTRGGVDNWMGKKVTLQFAIDEEGQVIKISVLKSAGSLLDIAAIKVLAESPCWLPGIQNQRPVKVWMEYEVRFRRK